MAAPSKTVPHPGRALVLLLVLIVAMLLGVLGPKLFAPSQWEHRFKVGLGLDLSSGTQVTLQAQTLTGKAPSADEMNAAVGVIESRVNGTGNSGAQVQPQGTDLIIVTVPGKGSQQTIQLVSSTALLMFRQVLLYEPYSATSTTTPGASPSASATPSASGTSSAKATPSASSTSTAKTSAKILPAASASASPSASASGTASPSGSVSPSSSASPSASPSASAASGAAGNASLAEYASRYNGRVSVVPSTVSMREYRPRPDPRADGVPVVGWTGSHSSLQYLAPVREVLRALRARRPFRLLVIGVGAFAVPGVDVECRPWSAATEVRDLWDMDVGIMPLPDAPWARGKCGMKAIQYMGVGIPAVVSPVGANREIVVDGVTGLHASTDGEWVDALDRLLGDRALRRRLGAAGRDLVRERYSAEAQAPRVAEVLRSVAERAA